MTPNGYKLSDGEKKRKKSNKSACDGNQNNGRIQHYDVDETMGEQFDRISRSVHGGLERGGKARRVQPVIGGLLMVAKSYAMTPRALKTATEWLNEEARALHAKSGDLTDSSALQMLVRGFVNRISKVS